MDVVIFFFFKVFIITLRTLQEAILFAPVNHADFRKLRLRVGVQKTNHAQKYFVSFEGSMVNCFRPPQAKIFCYEDFFTSVKR